MNKLFYVLPYMLMKEKNSKVGRVLCSYDKFSCHSKSCKLHLLKLKEFHFRNLTIKVSYASRLFDVYALLQHRWVYQLNLRPHRSSKRRRMGLIFIEIQVRLYSWHLQSNSIYSMPKLYRNILSKISYCNDPLNKPLLSFWGCRW